MKSLQERSKGKNKFQTEPLRTPIFRREIAIKGTKITHPVIQSGQDGVLEPKSG